VNRALGHRGLDWHNFFVANVQTGFGPFIAVYLASQAWTQRDIGTVLSIGTVAGIASQLPAGALVDAIASKRLAALVACLAIAASALLLAFFPARFPVGMAEVLHGVASCMLAPAIAAMSLALVGRDAFGERVGRNARFAAIGSGIAAAVMGAAGALISERFVFYLTAGLMIPAIGALYYIPTRSVTAGPARWRTHRVRAVLRAFLNWRVLVFATCVALFHLGNAAMLPILAAQVTRSMGSRASLVIAACIVLPQVLVAWASPFVGRAADRWGRRPVLMLTFLAVPVRGVLLAVVPAGVPAVIAQGLDGVSAAGFGVLLPLLTADFTRGTNRFNLGMGLFGLAAGVGATVSTQVGGIIADDHGYRAALLALAAAGLASVALIGVALPETKRRRVKALT
jgi:MFS family permease